MQPKHAYVYMYVNDRLNIHARKHVTVNILLIEIFELVKNKQKILLT